MKPLWYQTPAIVFISIKEGILTELDNTKQLFNKISCLLSHLLNLHVKNIIKQAMDKFILQKKVQLSSHMHSMVKSSNQTQN